MLFDSSLYTYSTPNPRKERNKNYFLAILQLHKRYFLARCFFLFSSGVKFLADGELND